MSANSPNVENTRNGIGKTVCFLNAVTQKSSSEESARSSWEARVCLCSTSDYWIEVKRQEYPQGGRSLLKWNRVLCQRANNKETAKLAAYIRQGSLYLNI